MRRARLSVKPNVGGPKARQTAAKQSEEGTIKAEEASSKTMGSSEIKESDSCDSGGITVIQSDVPPENEAKSSEKRVPVRRLTAKPKPNLPGRCLDRNKITNKSITTEPNAGATEGFTSIKTSLSESDVPKESMESKEAKLEKKNEKNFCDKVEVTQEEKSTIEPDSKDPNTEDNKRESKQLPSRFRSRFAKARPNVEAVARPRIRHPSLSQSETDSFSMKEPPPVQRVVTLTNSESATSLPVFTKPKEIQSGKDLIDIRKTPLKAPAREEYIHKQEGQGKKKKKLLVLEDPVDRGKLKMKDLIHMNPKSNPMKTLVEDERERKDSLSSVSTVETPRKRKYSSSSNTSTSRVKVGPDGQIIIDEDDTEIDKENEKVNEENDGGDEGDGDDSVPAPQVTIGADGQIVLNEASLVLDNPIHETSQEDMEIVHESNWSKSTSQYGYKKKRVKLWTEAETKKFYLALNAVGTDFSLMLKLFPGRSRAELKRKWQKEEKTSRHLLDKAIKDRYQFENDFFEELRALDKLDEDLRASKRKKKNEKPVSTSDDQSESNTNKKRVRKKETGKSLSVNKTGEPTKKKRKKAKGKLYVDSSSESDQEEPQFLEKDTPSTHEDETIDETQVIANFQSKPSRSGRTIKTFILGQPGATNTVTTSTDGGSSPLLSPKPSTEIRIRRISGTAGSPSHPVGRLRTLSTSSQGSTRVRTLSGSSTASAGKTPGQFLALSNIQQGASESTAGANEMQPGSLVFVQSNPSVDEKGKVTPGLVHIYMVSSPSSTNTPSASKEPVSGATFTPGGFKSNQFSLMRTPDSETDEREKKVFHCPSILGKSPKRSPLPLRKMEDLSGGKSLSHTLSESQTLLEQDSALPVNDINCVNTDLQTVEVVHVDEAMDASQDDLSYNVVTAGNEELVEHTENVVSDHVDIANEDEEIVYVEITAKNDNIGE